MRVLLVYPNTMLSTLVPIHFSVIAPCLREKGIEVELFDTTFYKTEEVSVEQRRIELLQIKPFNFEENGIFLKTFRVEDDFKKKIVEFEPDLIAFTVVEDTWKLTQALLEKTGVFDIPVIVGGVLVTAAPEEIISNEHVDMICLGEGEEALADLCEKISNGEDYYGIKNLWVKKDRRIIKNSLRSLTDLNKLPFIDYDIWGRERLVRPMFGKIYTMIHVEIDRGCPNQCAYCAAPLLKIFFREHGCGSYYRRKKTDRIIAEMEHLLKKYQPDYVNFNSETFLARPLDDFREFARQYKEKISLPFWAQTRPETITEEKIKLLKDMGCNSLNFGLEHGNEVFRRDILFRHGTNKQIIDSIKIVERYQIPYTVNNIIGFPNETRELIFDTIELNRQLNPRTINCYLFVPYKGTHLYKYCLEKGYITKETKVHNLTDSTRLNMDSISYEELKGLQRTFPLYIRFPKSEWPKIKLAEKFNEEGNQIFKEYKQVYRERYF